MTLHWYALHVKPHKERSVYELMQSRAVAGNAPPDEPAAAEVFFPAVRVKPVNPRSAKVRPYFPGYLFVLADLEQIGVNAFSWIPGTRGLVSFGEEPSVVPDNLIAELKQRMVHIAEAGGLVFDGLKQGDRVRIVSGPLAGYEAIFDAHLPGRERVQVLLAFLSAQPQPIKMDVSAIEKVKKSKAKDK